MEEMKNECRTKEELEQELEALRAENGNLQDAKESLSRTIEEMTDEATKLEKDKSYWIGLWNEEYTKNKVYVKRLQTMQHTITLLAGMLGDVDVTALTKEEQA